MTSGTKILIAASALFVGVLVLYYGFIMSRDAGEPELAVIDPSTAAERGESPDAQAAGNHAPLGSSAAEGSMNPFRLSDAGAADLPANEGEAAGVRAVQDPARNPRNSRNPPPPFSTNVFSMLEPGRSGSAGKGDASVPVDHAPSVPESSARANVPATTLARQPLPATASNPESARGGESSALSSYTIRNGDTLSSIASKWFGDAQKWDLIVRENPSLDPKRLRIGQTIRLPMPSAARQPGPETAVSANGARTHVVQSGDTLSSIARRFYGDEARWQLVWNANRGAIGGSPDDLEVGTVLTIPAR